MALSWDLVDVDTSELGVGPLILTDVLTVVSDLIFRLSAQSPHNVRHSQAETGLGGVKFGLF